MARNIQKDTPSSRGRSLGLQGTAPENKGQGVGKKKTREKRSLAGKDLVEKKRPEAPDAGESGPIADAKVVGKTAQLGGAVWKKLPAKERLKVLHKLGDDVYALLNEAGWFSSRQGPWADAYAQLKKAGLNEKTRVGAAYDPKLEGDALRTQKTEWMLGQLYAVMGAILEGDRVPHDIYRYIHLTEQPEKLPFGEGLLDVFTAQEQRNQRLKLDFITRQRREGLLEAGGPDRQFEALFESQSPSGHDLAKFLGRRVAAVVEEKFESSVVTGTLVPKQADDGEIHWRVQPAPDQPAIQINVNHLRSFFVEDRSALTWVEAKKNYEAKGWLASDSDVFRDLIGHLDPNAQKGRQAAFFVPDTKTQTWKVLEGVIRPVQGALFDLETAGGKVRLNSNSLYGVLIEDRSDITPKALAARAKAEGLRPLEYPSDWGLLEGKHMLALTKDEKAGAYRLHEGTIRARKDGRLGALFELETAKGKIELNTNNLLRAYVAA